MLSVSSIGLQQLWDNRKNPFARTRAHARTHSFPAFHCFHPQTLASRSQFSMGKGRGLQLVGQFFEGLFRVSFLQSLRLE